MPHDTDATYGSAILPPEQPTYSASWTENQSGPSSFDAGTMGQATYSHGPSAQNFIQLSQPAIPPVAAPTPQREPPSAAGPSMYIAASPYYYPQEYAAASHPNNSVPGSALPQYPETYSSRENDTADTSSYEEWEGQ